VWAGFKFQCQDCGAVLEEGDKFARMDDDSSTVLCLDCLTKRQVWAKEHNKPVGPTEHKDEPRRHRRGHRRSTEWMEFERD